MLYEILAFFIATLTMSLNMAKRKNYIKLADRAKLFMEKHKRNFTSRGAGHDLPPWIRELCTLGGLPYEDWESLRSDERFTQKHYSLPEPVYEHEESCESCGLIYEDEILCVACPLAKENLTNAEMVTAAWKRASAVLGIPDIAQRYNKGEHNMNLESSMLWLARMLRINPGDDSAHLVFDALAELPIHRAEHYTSTETLCQGGVNVFTIETPTGTHYVQFVGRTRTELPEPLPMSSDEAEQKAVEAAEEHKYVEEVIAAKTHKPVSSKKLRMRANMKKIQAHRRR